jgi:hypothetical protein
MDCDNQLSFSKNAQEFRGGWLIGEVELGAPDRHGRAMDFRAGVLSLLVAGLAKLVAGSNRRVGTLRVMPG